MVASRSALTRAEIVDRLRDLIGDDQVDTDARELREASVDRFKKYTSVHGIFDGPIPAAIAYARSTEDVSAILSFAEENLINIVPRTGRTATEGGLETIVEDTIVLDGSRMDAILEIDPIDMMVTAQCGLPLQVLEDTLPRAGPDDRTLPAVQALGADGRTRRDALHRPVLHALRWHRGYGGRPRSGAPRWTGHPDQERAPSCRRSRHPAHRDRQRRRTLRDHRSDGEGVPVPAENNRFLGYLVDSLPAGVAGLRVIIVAGYHPSVARAYSKRMPRSTSRTSPTARRGRGRHGGAEGDRRRDR